MAETARAESLDTRKPWRRRAMFATLSVLVAVGIWGIIWELFTHRSGMSRWQQTILPPLAILGLVMLNAARHHRFWVRPARHCMDLLAEIRRREAPIEELSRVGGGVKPLIPTIQELLRELRQREADITTLRGEMDKRVQHRTDKLHQVISSLRTQATRDSLTGLHNRRLLDSYLPQLVETCRSENSELALLMIDVDDFKQLNDTLGHAAGDALLRDIGKLIRSTIRDSDAAFRLGGDEFTILMPGATEEAANSLANRLGSLVDALGKTLRVPQQPRLSIGVSRMSQIADCTPQSLLADADAKLYHIKFTRKNKPVPPSAAA